MRFIGYDSIQTRLFMSYRFQIRTITYHQYKRIGPINKSIDKCDRFISVSLFTECISNQIYYSGRGYTEMKLNNHKVSSLLAQQLLGVKKYIKEMLNPYIVRHSYFLIFWESFHGERVRPLENYIPLITASLL